MVEIQLAVKRGNEEQREKGRSRTQVSYRKRRNKHVGSGMEFSSCDYDEGNKAISNETQNGEQPTENPEPHCE